MGGIDTLDHGDMNKTRKLLLTCVLLIAGSVHAQDNPAVAVPPGTQPSAGQGAPTVNTPPPPTTDTQTALPPLPADETRNYMNETPPSQNVTEEEFDRLPNNEYYGEREYFSFLGSYLIPDGHRDTTRHGGGMSVIYGHQFTRHLALEIDPTISIFDTGHNKGTDFYEYGGTVDAVYSFSIPAQDRFSPYILGGAGPVFDDVQPSGGKKIALLADAGVGVLSQPVFYGVKIRGEGRYVHDFYGEFAHKGFNDYRISLGIEIPLGRVVRSVAPAPRPVEMVKLVTVPRPWVDSDGDGVDDEHDKCPGTPKGFKVDSDGCIIPGQTITLRGVTFEFNKDRLTPNARSLLDTILPAFVGQPSLRVEVAGHTDSIGSVAYNQGLSQRRAESVRQYLISQGAKPEQIIAKGYGKSQPLVNPEKTADDREMNRRVEFRVTGK